MKRSSDSPAYAPASGTVGGAHHSHRVATGAQQNGWWLAAAASFCLLALASSCRREETRHGQRPALVEGVFVEAHDTQRTGHFRLIPGTQAARPGAPLVRWRTTIGTRTGLAPCVVNGRVYAGSVDGEVCCLDGSSGAVLWRQDVGFVFGAHASPVPVGDAILVSGQAGLVSLRMATGEPLWRVNTEYITHGLAADSEFVAFGSADGYLRCVNVADGSLRWRLDTHAPVLARPSIVRDVIYCPNTDNEVYAVRAQSGELVWRTIIGPAFGSYCVLLGDYIGVDGVGMHWLRRADGRQVWVYRGSAIPSCAPIVVEGLVCVALSDRRLHGLDVTTGEPRWDRRLPGQAVGLFCDGAMLYAGCDTGALCILDARTGEFYRSVDCGEPLTGVPVVCDRLAFVATRGGSIVAVELARTE